MATFSVKQILTSYKRTVYAIVSFRQVLINGLSPFKHPYTHGLQGSTYFNFSDWETEVESD